MRSEPPIADVGVTRLSSKGQIVIPSDMRERAGIDAGTEFTITLCRDGTFQLAPRRRRSIAELAGILHRPGVKPMSARDMDKAIGDWIMADYERISGRKKSAAKTRKKDESRE